MDRYPIKQQTPVVKSINNSQEFVIMYQVITLGSVEGSRVIGNQLSRVLRGTDTNPSTSASIRGIGKKENLPHPCLDSIIINNSETGNSTHCMPNSLKSSLLSWSKRTKSTLSILLGDSPCASSKLCSTPFQQQHSAQGGHGGRQ